MRRCALSAAFFSATFVAVTLLVAPGYAPAGGKKAKANDGVITNWGKPKDFTEGKVNAYWLWYDDGVWHFRTTGGGKGAHRFNGTIEVAGGRLVGLKGKKGEYGGPNADKYIYNATGTAIAFDFKTDEGIDGINFAVDPRATTLKFTLALDGDAAPKHIRIGKAGDHPAQAVFTVPAHPPEPPEPKGKGKKK